MVEDFDIEIRNGKKTLIKYHGNKQHVIIPDDIEIISFYAFGHNSSIYNVQIPHSVTEIRSSAFENCHNLVLVEIPEGVRIIDKGAFSQCTWLTSMHIPGSVTEIGEGAFANCCSLVSVVIYEGVKEIQSTAFSHCTSLTNLQLPNSLLKIGSEAFADCSSLTSVVIPKGINRSIGKHFGIVPDWKLGSFITMNLCQQHPLMNSAINSSSSWMKINNVSESYLSWILKRNGMIYQKNSLVGW